MTLKKVTPGDPFQPSSELHNATVDTIADFRARQQMYGDAAGRVIYQPAVALIRNDSGADRGRFEVLGIDGSVILPADNLPEWQNRVALTGITPAIADHVLRFVVTLEPIPDGKIGRGLLAGVIQVRMLVANELFDYASVDDGECSHLKTGGMGPLIVWKAAAGTEDADGYRWALVELGNIGGQKHQGKLDANLLYNDTTGVTVSVWNDVPLADSTTNIDNVLPPILLTTGQLDSGDPVFVEWMDGHWYVTGAPCA